MHSSFPLLSRISFPHSFRLGVPSYVYPVDILPNVEALAPYVDDIELVLFESGKPAVRDQRSKVSLTNIPAPDIIQRLAELAQQHGLTYTIHFPIDRHLGSPSAAERLDLRDRMLAIMDRVRPLKPFAYILHLEGVSPASGPTRIRTWQHDIGELLPVMIERAGDPALLCVENLDYPFGWCEPLLDTFGLGACIDLGHLWVGGYDADAHLKRYLPCARVIHLHGARAGRDHLALTALPPNRLRHTLNSIANFSAVLTLELFSYEAVRDSLAVMSEVCNRKPTEP